MKYPYDRINKWLDFSQEMQKHIEEYTKPQYGSKPGDEQVDSFTVEDCMKAIERYVNRRHVRIRGDMEALRDLLKIAHYAQFAYDKMRQAISISTLYPPNKDNHNVV